MRQKITILMLLAGLMLSSCASMKDLDGAYASKDLQKAIKEYGSYVDTLKSQNRERYTYRILAENAREMATSWETLSLKAPDSYFRRMAKRIGRQSEVLYQAAERKNADATEAAIDDVLDTWKIIQEYQKP